MGVYLGGSRFATRAHGKLGDKPWPVVSLVLFCIGAARLSSLGDMFGQRHMPRVFAPFG